MKVDLCFTHINDQTYFFYRVRSGSRLPKAFAISAQDLIEIFWLLRSRGYKEELKKWSKGAYPIMTATYGYTFDRVKKEDASLIMSRFGEPLIKELERECLRKE